MRHRIQAERIVGASGIDSCRGQTSRRQSFTDKQNDAERSLHDPVLEIKNAERREHDQAEKREDLVAPFHRADVERPPGIVNPATRETACALR